jgi:hypothetical protein
VSYLIFTDIKEAEAHQAKVDEELHYPESLDSLRYIGGGIHAPKELGRAMHYSYIDTDKTALKFALAVDARSKEATPTKAAVATELVDWKEAEALPIEEEIIKG